jgi:hypothetical protein
VTASTPSRGFSIPCRNRRQGQIVRTSYGPLCAPVRPCVGRPAVTLSICSPWARRLSCVPSALSCAICRSVQDRVEVGHAVRIR